ncbi:uncharacterized protein LOC130054487 [Ostrea edulis]|uniref:uncharacterized protein LOC130054487 n=1 Tax=Ostrea edulis TaxID=37623 RepID=UPI0024AF2C39|nr:uncharacterized protein LOC130054487 [Ostrea edulis]
MDIYNDDTRGQLYRTKLTHDHMYLTPSSTMSVKLAVQVLSNSVAQVMRAYYGPEVSETARLFGLVNRCFDCLNVRSLRESLFERKPDVAPYTSQNDPRFQFLEDEFLEYFNQWLISLRYRPVYKKTEQNKIFVSYQTHEDIIMTVKFFIEATRYLLQQEVPYIFSNVFCRDSLEEHFGPYRGLETRHDNPTIHQLGYQENQLQFRGA